MSANNVQQVDDVAFAELTFCRGHSDGGKPWSIFEQQTKIK
jgi:hypothetical protein